MSQLSVDSVIPQSGTTVTLGASGDTINIPSGVTMTNSGTASGFGKVLQVVKGASSTLFSTTSSSKVNTNVAVTITPSSTSSIILVSYNAYFYRSGSGSGDAGLGSRDVQRDGSVIISPAYGSVTRSTETDSGILYDAPATTSAVNYVFRVARADTYTINVIAGSYMVAMEIAG